MTYRELLQEGKRRLAEGGNPEAERDAMLLLEGAFGFDFAAYLSKAGDTVPEGREPEAARYGAMLSERLNRRPVAYILGEWEFMGLPFTVNENVLIPEQDTELLAEEALTRLKPGDTVFDLCTGSGCLAVSLAKLAKGLKAVWASDISENALEIARENASRNGAEITFRQGDFFAALSADKAENALPLFSMIVCNPPYIAEEEYRTLEPEVNRFEPKLALVAEENGLAFYRRLAAEAAGYLAPGGVLLAEIGEDQKEAVLTLFTEASVSASDGSERPLWKLVECKEDYNHLPRLIAAEKA